MGGKSKSSQATTNQQISNNFANDGEFAGASNVSVDSSDNSQEWDIDESIDIDDSYNTDNSTDIDGDGYMANGDINVLDGGAIDALKDTAKIALTTNEKVTSNALNSVEYAIDEVGDIATDSVTQVGKTSESVIKELAGAVKANSASNEKALASVATANSKDKAIIAELAKNTSLGGQDIVARSSEKMTMYMSVAVAIAFVALIFMGGKRNA
jgi:hypothetical protein